MTTKLNEFAGFQVHMKHCKQQTSLITKIAGERYKICSRI